MSKETEQFLPLYRTYESLLRQRGTDYRTVEEEQFNKGITRMTVMRQMRNYLSHADDPGFVIISPVCIRALEQMVKEERMRGDIVKNHLVTPAKGSIKENTMLSQAIYRISVLAMLGTHSIPVYDNGSKRLKGVVMLEQAAFVMSRDGDMTVKEAFGGHYGDSCVIVRPDVMAADAVAMASWNGTYICCTKDGTMDSQYLGYLDKSYAVPAAE